MWAEDCLLIDNMLMAYSMALLLMFRLIMAHILQYIHEFLRELEIVK
jgi:hypothetical protein